MIHPKLKVKLCALAAEQRIIRQMEQKIKQQMDNCRIKVEVAVPTLLPGSVKFLDNPTTTKFGWQTTTRIKGAAQEHIGHILEHHEDLMALKEHRIGTNGRGGLRLESRHTSLAYGFLRGTPYQNIEQWHRPGNAPDLDKIHDMIERFGGPMNRGELDTWYVEPPEDRLAA